MEDTNLSQRYARRAQELLSSFPPSCPSLKPHDLELTGRHPIAAGGFANIWEATYHSRKVVLKSYRCYASFDTTTVEARFPNEVLACNLLRHEDVNIPFIGVYSTEAHPFSIVYEYMENLDLKQYLRNKPDVGRLKLLTDISQVLNRMHNLGIIHGALKTTNILIDNDGTPRIGGLGNVLIDATTNQLVRTQAHKPGGSGLSPDVTDCTPPTRADDMYAFGVMAFEVLTGGPPFSDLSGIAAKTSMLKGNRPPRPRSHKISDDLWHVVEGCWRNSPSQRMSIGQVVDLLEQELQRPSNPSQTSSRFTVGRTNPKMKRR